MAGLIRRITVENYMSHARSVLEPAAGLTVLTGTNNVGKSALVHALETLCYNNPADFAVKHGEREATITVETDDGHTIVWRRHGGKVSYVINGREVHRLRGGVPDDLHEILRMPPIVPAGGTDKPFYVNFALQKSPIFLLDDSPGRAATFFASSSDAEKLLEMQKRHKEKIRDARRDADRLDGEIARYEARLAALEPADALSTEVAALERSHEQIIAQSQASDAGQRAAEAIAACERRVAHIAERSAAMAELSPPPTPIDTEPLERLIAAIIATERREDRDAQTSGVLEALRPAPSLEDEGVLAGTIDTLAASQSSDVRLSLRCDALVSLATPPIVGETRSIEHAIAALGSASERVESDNARAVALGDLREAPDQADLAVLMSSILQIEHAADKQRAIELVLAACEQHLQSLTDDVRQWTERHPNCPTCGGPTSVEHMLAEAHADE
jgi:exonuclease SbcC